MSKENLRDGELSANNVDTYTSVSHQDTLPSNLSLLRLRGCQVKHQDVVVREVRTKWSRRLEVPSSGSLGHFSSLHGRIHILIWKSRNLYLSPFGLCEELQNPHPSVIIDYEDVKVATRNFHRSNKIGEGAFGAVYKVRIFSFCLELQCIILRCIAASVQSSGREVSGKEG